jgi:hypothetical protein
MTQQEAAFIYKIMGVSLSTKTYIQEADFVGNSAVSLPNGYASGIITFNNQNTLRDSFSKGGLLHEWFHQYQYEDQAILARLNLLGEMLCNKIFGNDEGYDFGDYTMVSLSKYDTLENIPTYEGRAQLVGQFAQLYDQFEINPDSLGTREKSALKEQARILHNSGFNSEAINKINDWEW